MIKKIIKVMFLLVLISQSSYAQYSEYELKAAYLKSISLFIEWPSKRLSDSVFVITVVGENPFNNYLEDLAQKTKINQKRVQINYTKNLNIPNSQIVFISSSEQNRLENILAKLENNKQTLIIGDTAGYAERGIHLNFYNNNDNILFEINLSTIKKTSLKFSSRLIQLSKIID